MRNKKLILSRIKLLGKHVLMQIKVEKKNGPKKRRESEGKREKWERKSAGPSCEVYLTPDLNTVRHPSEGLCYSCYLHEDT